MNATDALNELATRYGILPNYNDLGGQSRATSPDTQRALLRANGLDVATDAMIFEVLDDVSRREAERWFPEEIIIQSTTACALDFGLGTTWSVLCTETGDCLAQGRADDRIELPALRAGVYDLIAATPERCETITVIVAPPRAPLIDDLTPTDRLWGVNAALYGLRGGNHVGNFEDLAEFGEVLSQAGAGFFGVNPLHALGAMAHEVISPYSPSSRSALNTSHIALDQIPGLRASSNFSENSRPAAPSDSSIGDIDYPAHKAAHGAALEARYAEFCANADAAAKNDFAKFEPITEKRRADFSIFEAISEFAGPDWRGWPAELRTADGAALRQVVETKPDRINFHRWLQWVANKQLAGTQSRLLQSGMPLGLYLDLAVGARRGGAESWCEADSVAAGVSVGAPPDHLSPAGQNWDLAAFAPRRLKAQKYKAFRRILRAAMRHAGVLRIDHVLGLNRSFWIPDDGSPGGYISQPMEALTAIIRIEAERANTMIIGEDLGLVPEGFREQMRGQGFYGYSVLQYEKIGPGAFRHPNDYEPQILACFGTHDTPTLRGFRSGRDIDWWRKLDWISEDAAAQALIDRQADVKAVAALGRNADDENTPSDRQFSCSVHGALAQCPSALVSVQLDDILFNTEAQNLPGTIDQHPNWRRAYATTPEELLTDPHLKSISDWMRDAGRAPISDTVEEAEK